MTDRELLELAAKAAGYTVTAWVEDANGVERFQVYSEKSMWLEWSPLADDGDALRMAMKLGFNVEPGRCWHSPYGPAFGEDVSFGEMAATRRAIVRAAAAIGEAMQ